MGVIDGIKHKLQLQRGKKIVGVGPFLDILGVCCIIETKTIEEMGEIFFNSPSKIHKREVHHLGTIEDTLEEIMEFEKPKKRGKQRRGFHLETILAQLKRYLSVLEVEPRES